MPEPVFYKIPPIFLQFSFQRFDLLTNFVSGVVLGHVPVIVAQQLLGMG